MELDPKTAKMLELSCGNLIMKDPVKKVDRMNE